MGIINSSQRTQRTDEDKAISAHMASQEYTDRGGAKIQDKSWIPGKLKQNTQFIHCGSAPSDAILSPSYAKETCIVKGNDIDPSPPKQYVLALRYNGSIKDKLSASGPIEKMWSRDETPRAFLFEIPKDTIIYADRIDKDEADPQNNTEVAFAIDIQRSMIKAVYERGHRKKDEEFLYKCFYKEGKNPKKAESEDAVDYKVIKISQAGTLDPEIFETNSMVPQFDSSFTRII